MAVRFKEFPQEQVERLCVRYDLPRDASPLDLATVLVNKRIAKSVLGGSYNGVRYIQGPEAENRVATRLSEAPRAFFEALCTEHGFDFGTSPMDLAKTLVEKRVAKEVLRSIKGLQGPMAEERMTAKLLELSPAQMEQLSRRYDLPNNADASTLAAKILGEGARHAGSAMAGITTVGCSLFFFLLFSLWRSLLHKQAFSTQPIKKFVLLEGPFPTRDVLARR